MVTSREKRWRRDRNRARFEAAALRRLLERVEFVEWGVKPAWWGLVGK